MNIVNGFDTSVRKHKHNPESDAAFERIKGSITEECLKVLAQLLKHPEGLTGKEIAENMGKPFNEVSGRVTDVKTAGYAYASNLRRDGGAVVRITEAGKLALERKAQRGLW